MQPAEERFDYILCGGGLQAGLLVLSIKHLQPEAKVLLVERGQVFGGNHTWSFHASDVPASAKGWLRNVEMFEWDSYRVQFPNFVSSVDLNYCSMTSARLGQAVERALHLGEETSSRMLLGMGVLEVGPHTVTTSCGRKFNSRCVIDCRGQRRNASHSKDNRSSDAPIGYQKFYGVEIELEEDWPYEVPTLMDACVDQSDGFHFIYVLPFTRRQVLVEDTWFSNQSKLDTDMASSGLAKYIAQHTRSSYQVNRVESGCLPMPLRGMSPRPKQLDDVPAVMNGGYAGGWFHAATGYSFPLAAKFAAKVAAVAPEEAAVAIQRLSEQHTTRFAFSRFLNRLLFRLVRDDCRWQIFRRLYRSLPVGVLSRFYAHEFTSMDALRMVVGIPPRGLTPLRFLNGMRNDLQRHRSPKILETHA